ncbi:DNA-binding protein [Actinomycetota bacterium]|nr:DNA-binding protein [Actinomycetota bacterium]
MIAFIDTNVIIDVLSKRPGYETSAPILEMCEAGNITGYATTSTITDIVYILSQYLDKKTAKQKTAELLEILELAVVEKADIQKALDHEMADFEDAVLALCAKRHKADMIITRNIKDFKLSPVDAVEPDDKKLLSTQ